MSMKDETAAEKAEVAETVVVEEGSAAAAAAEGAGKKAGKKSRSNKQNLYENQPKPVRCATGTFVARCLLPSVQSTHDVFMFPPEKTGVYRTM